MDNKKVAHPEHAESTLQEFVVEIVFWSKALNLSHDAPVATFIERAIEKAEIGEHPGVTAEEVAMFFIAWPWFVRMLGLPASASMLDFCAALMEIASMKGEDFTWTDLQWLLGSLILTMPKGCTPAELIATTQEALLMAS
jgi:hypothetical protein